MIPGVGDYADELNSLYDVVGFAICGLSDGCNQANRLAYSFLDELFEDNNHPYISGEPGWSIIRVNLLNFEDKYSDSLFLGKSLESLSALKNAGENEAYCIDDLNSSQRETIVNNQTFWLAVRNSLIAFRQLHPGREDEIDEGFRRYAEFLLPENPSP